jgi:hypothetical protein
VCVCVRVRVCVRVCVCMCVTQMCCTSLGVFRQASPVLLVVRSFNAFWGGSGYRYRRLGFRFWSQLSSLELVEVE